MDYLVDTHVCLWAIADKGKLSDKVRSILEDTHEKILVSQVSPMEIAIKISAAKFENAILISKDEHFKLYSDKIKILW